MKLKSIDTFINETKIKHPNITIIGTYVNGRTKIELKCNVCNNIFFATPGSLYMGHGCPKCAGVMTKSTKQFIEELKNINPLINVLGDYLGCKKSIDVLCGICENKWTSTPNSLLSGKRCPYCYGNIRKDNSKFVEEMKIKHPNITVLSEYKNNREKVECKCNNCNGIFNGIPHSMLNSGHGCPYCNISKGERKIRNCLIKNNINFFQEYSFKDCKDKRVLPFDFYIPDKNTAIEFDGKQHYEINDFFGGKDAFDKTKKHDEIKNKYCSTHNIYLLRIPYWNLNNIENILLNNLVI